jgi:hypothetical protein
MRLTARLAAILLCSLLVGGCSATALSNPPSLALVPTLPPGVEPLPVANWQAGGQQYLCTSALFPIPAHLHGSASDPRRVWITLSDGSRRDVAWPQGYGVRFAPEAQVIDARGDLVVSEGSEILGACGTADPGILYVASPAPDAS